MHSCCCDIYLGSAIELSVGAGAHTVFDDTKEAWEALFVLSSSSHRDPNGVPTEVVPSTPVPPDEGTPSIAETPKFNPDYGGSPLEEPAIGVATRIDMGSHKPLLFCLNSYKAI